VSDQYPEADAPSSAAADPILAEHAAAIRALRSRIVSDVAEIGRRLSEVKARVGHGQWLPWLDREFGWTDHTALNFMRVHEYLAANPKTVSDLVLTFPVSAVYLLAAPSTPVEARDAVIARAQAGDTMPVAEVRRVITDTKGRKKKRRSREEMRLERFTDALSMINNICMTGAEMIIPHLSASDHDDALKRVASSVAHLKTLKTRINAPSDIGDDDAEPADVVAFPVRPKAAESVICPDFCLPATTPSAIARIKAATEESPEQPEPTAPRSWKIEATDVDGNVWTQGVRYPAQDAAGFFMGNACHDLRGYAVLVQLRVVPSGDEPNVDIGRNRKGHPTRCIFQDSDCHLFVWSHPGLDCEEAPGCDVATTETPAKPASTATPVNAPVEMPDLPDFLKREAP
jgi:Protein of unknown function (DUF3102)